MALLCCQYTKPGSPVSARIVIGTVSLLIGKNRENNKFRGLCQTNVARLAYRC